MLLGLKSKASSPNGSSNLNSSSCMCQVLNPRKCSNKSMFDPAQHIPPSCARAQIWSDVQFEPYLWFFKKSVVHIFGLAPVVLCVMVL